MDDRLFIAEDPNILHPWPPWKLLLSIRPVVDLTLSLNYALGGFQVWGYHFFNLTVHLLAALALFGIVRRTLQMNSLRTRFGSSAPELAAVISTLWLVHPLQTQSVNYIIQRAELLMGLFYLLTLYCFIRSAEGDSARRWQSLSVLCCALGMGSKSIMVTVPLLVFLYDRTFLSSSNREILRQRGIFYLGLFATWGIQLYFLPKLLKAPTPTIGFHLEQVSWLEYLRTQPGVIFHYLKLALWPNPLVFDMYWPIARDIRAVGLPAIPILTLILGTLWGLSRRLGTGFLGAWFFLILAPTSSFIPVADLTAEHRMYLSLAAVAALVVLGGYRLGLKGKIAAVLAIAAGAGFISMTLLRNEDYRSEVLILSDSLKKQPGNARAHNYLGIVLTAQNKCEQALAHFSEAYRLEPEYADAYYNAGIAFARLGKYEKAIPLYLRALQLKPDAQILSDLGLALANQGKMEEAVQVFSRALRLKPNPAEFYKSVGLAFIVQGQSEQAASYLQESLKINAEDAQAHSALGTILFQQGKREEAIPHYAQAVRVKPDWVEDLCNLGIALANQGRLKEAISQYRQALQFKPDYPEVHNNLGNALVRLGRLKEAIGHYTQALQFNPNFEEAHYNLGLCLGSQGRWEEADRHFERSGRQPPLKKIIPPLP